MTDPIEEARALLAAATPGPWTLHDDGFDGGVYGPPTNEYQRKLGRGLVMIVGGERHEGRIKGCDPNGALIAAAPTLLAALADECERLRADAVMLHQHALAANEAYAREAKRRNEVETDLRADLARVTLAAHLSGADLATIGEACGMRDDEYPLRAVQRVVADLARVTAERDARPAIMAEDCAADTWTVTGGYHAGAVQAAERIEVALERHGEKVSP